MNLSPISFINMHNPDKIDDENSQTCYDGGIIALYLGQFHSWPIKRKQQVP